MTNRIVAQASEDADLSQTKTVVDQEEITDTYALFIIDATAASVEGKMIFSAAPSKE